MIKNPPISAGDAREVGLISGSGKFPGGGNGNPLQYYCLKSPKDREAWQGTQPWGNTHTHTHHL